MCSVGCEGYVLLAPQRHNSLSLRSSDTCVRACVRACVRVVVRVGGNGCMDGWVDGCGCGWSSGNFGCVLGVVSVVSVFEVPCSVRSSRDAVVGEARCPARAAGGVCGSVLVRCPCAARFCVGRRKEWEIGAPGVFWQDGAVPVHHRFLGRFQRGQRVCGAGAHRGVDRGGASVSDRLCLNG